MNLKKSKIAAGPAKKKNLNFRLLEKFLDKRENFLREIQQRRIETRFLQLLFRYEFHDVIGRIHQEDEDGKQQREEAESRHDAQEPVEPAEQSNLYNFFEKSAQNAQNDGKSKKDHDERNGFCPEFGHFDVLQDPVGDGRGEAERKPDAEIDDRQGDQLLDESVLGADVECRKETAQDDDVDDAHGIWY